MDFCKHGNEHSGSEKAENFLTSYVAVSFSRRNQFHGVRYLVLLFHVVTTE
jgi:hypothetical protein